METLAIIGLSFLGIVLIIGIIRVIILPTEGFFDLLGHLFLIDLLGDLLGFVIEAIGEILD